MPPYLKALDRCACGRPATQALYNGVNALVSVHCDRHAAGALREFNERMAK